VICRVGDARYRGRAVTIEEPIDPSRLARAIRQGRDAGGPPPIEVECPTAGALHERVGCIHPDRSLRPRTALAAAARSRGWTATVDDELEAVRDALADLDEPPAVPEAADANRRLADATAEIDRLRERVAAIRGRVAADEAAADDLEAAVRGLSEVETAAAAARERRRATREAAREARDRLEERLRLEDRLGNVERRARRELVERATPDFRAALAAVPGLEDVPDPFDAPTDAVALAVARVGELEAPVVLATDRFPDAGAGADWLDAPVLRREP